MDRLLNAWRPSSLYLIGFVLCAGLVFVGQQFAAPQLSEIGFTILGPLVVTAGLDMLIKRLRAVLIDARTRAGTVEAVQAISEILWAIIIMLLGMGLLAVMLVKWLAPSTPATVWFDLLSQPVAVGAALVIVGSLLLANGIRRALIGSRSTNPQRLGGVPHLLDRLVGVAIILLGAAVSGIGFMVLLAPGVVSAFLEWAIASIFA